MHFYYLDEAGCTGCDLASQEQPIFVLGGISVRDKGWNATQEAMAEIIGEYFGNEIPQNFELHAAQLLSPNGDGPFSNHPRDCRDNLAKDILGLLDDRSHDVHLYAIDKEKLNSCTCRVEMPYDTRTPYHLAYDYLITYINWLLQEIDIGLAGHMQPADGLTRQKQGTMFPQCVRRLKSYHWSPLFRAILPFFKASINLSKGSSLV